MDESELDRLSELANIGAGHAASAFAMLTGRTIWMGVPKIQERGRTPAPPPAGRWTTGVIFEFEGCVEAIVAILFHATASEVVVRRVVGIEEDELAPHVIESALMEIGNILASHVASAIADTIGQRLLPSIPTLAMNHAEEALEQFVVLQGGRHPIRIESPLTDESGELSGVVVLIPTLEP